jgi:hypothetical protein
LLKKTAKQRHSRNICCEPIEARVSENFSRQNNRQNKLRFSEIST